MRPRLACANRGLFFSASTHDAFVIEDADHLLRARTDGNHDLHRFLAVADGVVRAQGRKIIFTTNLPNIRDMDEARRREWPHRSPRSIGRAGRLDELVLTGHM
jgi:hypothetical protein